MKQIFVANTSSDILRALGDQDGEQEMRRAFVCMSEGDARLIQLCMDRGLERIQIAPYSTDEREKFLREYIDVIGKISQDCASPWWWGTDIASRNRFASRIPELLQEFFSLTRTLEQSQYSVIVFLQPSWQIIPSLATFARQHEYEFSSPLWKLHYWWRHVHAWFHYIGSLVAETMALLGRIWEVRDIRRHVIPRVSEGSRSHHWYIIKTFLYNASAFYAHGNYHDAFFGALPDYLKKQGCNPLLYVRILGDYKKCVEKIRQFTAFPIIPFEAVVTLADISKAMRIVFFPTIHIRSNASFFDQDVTDIFINELHRTHNGLTFTTVLHYFATQKLLRIASADTFTLTYEGNPWERMCIKALRDVSRGTDVIGYAHTVVPPAAAGMFPSEYERGTMPQTDRVLTIGAVTKELLERYGAYKEGSVQASCALRLEYLRGLSPFPREKQKRILVALEGVTPVYQLARYVLRELWDAKDYELRFRSHPVLGLRDLGKLIPYDVAQLPPHMHESKGTSLLEDIQWSGVVMYWGSTVGLESLTLGRPVIHYQNVSFLNYDSLFDCPSLKWIVTDQTSLRSMLEEIMAMYDSEYEDKKIKAHEYLKEYVYPVSDNGLSVFL